MLQLILGRAGCGKTEYVFSSVKKLAQSGEKNILLITPEQFSFIAERRLLSELGESLMKSVENISFSRLSGEITRLYGGENLPVLTKGSKAVIMKKAIESVSDDLILFNRNISSVSFVNSAVKIYDEMKSCRVSVDDILQAEKDSDKERLKGKLHDLGLIIGMYDAIIENKYYDPAEDLTRLYEKLINLSYFKDRVVFIDGFSGFVAQEYKILEVILKQAKSVYITFCTDSYDNLDKYNLFYNVNSNIQILRDVSKKLDVEFKEPVYLNKPYRYKNPFIEYTEKYFFNSFKEPNEAVPDGIKIYGAKNIYDECDNAAAEISSLLRKGYRACDIAVIVRDLTAYQKVLSFSFNKFNIPYFDDERQAVTSEPLIMFVSFLLRILIYSFRSEDIFSLLKTGLTSLDDDDVCRLENYVYLWNISGNKWKNEFTESTLGFVDKISDDDMEKIKSVNASREYVVSRLEKFQKRCKNSSAKEIAKAVYLALIDFSADENLKELAISLDNNGKSALAGEQDRIWELLMNILNEIAVTGDDKKISVKEFLKLYNLMISNEDLGVVPIGLDNVQLGAADRMRCNNPRAVFILGANEGEFPQTVISSGLLSESDRVALINNDFKLYSYGDTLNAQEKYFAYMAVCSAQESLYVSYNTSGGGESAIVREIRDIFPNIRTDKHSNELNANMLESDSQAFEILASNYTKNDAFISSLENYFEKNKDYSLKLSAIKKTYENKEAQLNKKNAVGLFKKNMYLSASRIDDYYNCPYRYFCKFGLKAKPRVKAQMDPMQTGTVIHYVLECIIREKGGKGLLALGDDEIKALVNKYLEYYLKNKIGDSTKFSARFKYQFMRLSKMLVSVVKRLKAEFEQSDFEAKAFELKITGKYDTASDDEKSVKSKTFPLDDGGSVEIKGSVDRVDTYEENGKRYVRVVDYKSGNKQFLLEDILYGLNLQMFIYLYTICSSESEFSGIASGVLYMHSARRVFSIDRGKNKEEQLKGEEDKLYRMKGLVLNDKENDIAKHMEHDLKGRFIPVKLNEKSGVIKGDIVSLAQLGMISKKIESLIIKMGNSLHEGKISQHPINGKNHDKTCEYCDFRDVCMNRKEITARDMADMKNSQAMESIEKEYGGSGMDNSTEKRD